LFFFNFSFSFVKYGRVTPQYRVTWQC